MCVAEHSHWSGPWLSTLTTTPSSSWADAVRRRGALPERGRRRVLHADVRLPGARRRELQPRSPAARPLPATSTRPGPISSAGPRTAGRPGPAPRRARSSSRIVEIPPTSANAPPGLVAASDRGLFVSADGGATWSRAGGRSRRRPPSSLRRSTRRPAPSSPARRRASIAAPTAGPPGAGMAAAFGRRGSRLSPWIRPTRRTCSRALEATECRRSGASSARAMRARAGRRWKAKPYRPVSPR